MELKTALALFEAFEATRSTDDDPTTKTKPPTFDVRLDAVSEERRSNGVIARSFRVRVASSKHWGPANPEEWRFVLEQVEEHGLFMDLQNNAVEIS